MLIYRSQASSIILYCFSSTVFNYRNFIYHFSKFIYHFLIFMELYFHYLEKTLFLFAEIRNDESSSKLIEALQLLFLLVPPPNRVLLQQLLELLNLVTKTPHSKMTAHNLAVVFSPNIMDMRKVAIYFLKRFII